MHSNECILRIFWVFLRFLNQSHQNLGTFLVNENIFENTSYLKGCNWTLGMPKFHTALPRHLTIYIEIWKSIELHLTHWKIPHLSPHLSFHVAIENFKDLSKDEHILTLFCCMCISTASIYVSSICKLSILNGKKGGKCVLHVAMGGGWICKPWKAVVITCGPPHAHKIDSLFARWNHFLIDSSPALFPLLPRAVLIPLQIATKFNMTKS